MGEVEPSIDGGWQLGVPSVGDKTPEIDDSPPPAEDIR